MKPYKESLADQLNSSIVSVLKPGFSTQAWAENIIGALIHHGLFTIYFQAKRQEHNGDIVFIWYFLVPYCMSFEDHEVIQEAEQFLRNCFSTDDADPWIRNISMGHQTNNGAYDLYKEFEIEFLVDNLDFTLD